MEAAKRNRIIGLAIALMIIVAGALYFLLPKNGQQYGYNSTVEDHYLYNGYGLAKTDGLWHTAIRDRYNTSRYFDIALHYGPKEVQNFTFEGSLSKFIPFDRKMYVSFNPGDPNLGFVNLAAYELSLHLVKTYRSFQYDRFNLSVVCSAATDPACPEITENCNRNSPDKVILIRQAEAPKIAIDGNCTIIEGTNYDMIAGVDHFLYRLYGVIDYGVLG